MRAADAQSLLSCWEHGRPLHTLDRALLLHSLAAPEEKPDRLADRPVGERNAALLQLRASLFGDQLRSCVECPECREPLEFALSVATLLGPGASRANGVRVNGLNVRLPTTRDLMSIASEPDEVLAVRKLLERLVCDSTDPRQVSPDELSQALDQADPCADLAVALNCPACEHRWDAPLDVVSFVWDEIDVRARRLLDEVHVLAQAYGWTETEILRLPEARRHAYLERVLA